MRTISVLFALSLIACGGGTAEAPLHPDADAGGGNTEAASTDCGAHGQNREYAAVHTAECARQLPNGLLGRLRVGFAVVHGPRSVTDRRALTAGRPLAGFRGIVHS